jgi:hypothetical protein
MTVNYFCKVSCFLGDTRGMEEKFVCFVEGFGKWRCCCGVLRKSIEKHAKRGCHKKQGSLLECQMFLTQNPH